MKRIVFMGTGDFALEVLKKLYEEYHSESEIIVFTKENKPSGRGMKIKPGAVEIFASENGLDIRKPHTLKKDVYYDEFMQIAPDMVIVASYGLILPEYIIDFPKYGCINVHGSLLPKYRGAAPIARAVIDGEKKTGVTIMKMDKGLDTGDMIISEETPISEEDTAETVFERLSHIGAELLIKAVKMIESGTAVYTKQDDSLSTYAEKITNETRKINWDSDSESIFNQIRGLSPYPASYTFIHSSMLKIISAKKCKEEISGKPGEVIYKKPHLYIACKSGAIEIISAQPEGKSKMGGADLINGRKLISGDILE